METRSSGCRPAAMRRPSGGSLPSLLAVLAAMAACALAAPVVAADDSGGLVPTPEVVVDAPPAEPAPLEPAAAEPEPAPAPPPAPAAEPPPPEPAPVEPPPAETPVEPTEVGMAHNTATVMQVVVQVQRGCQRNCRGTRQHQEAVQRSEVDQEARSVGQAGAVAVNESRTVQFIWQQQIGCVAFCYDTSQVQSASQSALTTQTAEAVGSALALALNGSETRQLVWQLQESCLVECHGTSAVQLIGQEQRTDQTAGARGSPDEFLAWLTVVAANIGATLQTIFQYEDADCIEDCVDGVQIQLALQESVTTQRASVGEPAPPAPAALEPAQPASAPEAAAWDEPAAQPPVLAAAHPPASDRGRAERAPMRPRAGAPADGASPPPSANWGLRRSMAAGGAAASVDRTTGGRPAADPSGAATMANAPIEESGELIGLGLEELGGEAEAEAANPALLVLLLLALGSVLVTSGILRGARQL